MKLMILLAETMRALSELVELSVARYIGVSNFSLDLLRQAQALSGVPLAVNQIPYSLYQWDYVKNGVVDYCRKEGILITANSPLERGLLARDKILGGIAAKHQATPAQVALNWLVRQPGVIAIPMSMNPGHQQENLEALELELNAEDLNYLDQAGR